MTAAHEIRGADVIGMPGQNLTTAELAILVSLADGVPSPLIAQQLCADPADLRHVEANIQAKLGARNKVHMITRAFNLGVLIPNALCLLLCISSAVGIDHSIRTRSPARARGGDIARVLRTPATASGRGRTDLFA